MTIATPLSLRWERAQHIDPSAIEPLGLGWYIVPSSRGPTGYAVHIELDPAGQSRSPSRANPPGGVAVWMAVRYNGAMDQVISSGQTAAMAESLSTVPEVALGFLFGSYARGQGRPDSDVDCAVLRSNA
jgi:hypothetical protein